MEEETTIQWKSIIWSAILILILPVIAQFVATAIYPTYIGFQERGDTEAITDAINIVSQSPLMAVFGIAVFGLAALWRGMVLAAKAEDRPILHSLLAGGLGAVLTVAVVVAMGQNNIVSILTLVIVIMAGAYLGGVLGHKKAPAA